MEKFDYKGKIQIYGAMFDGVNDIILHALKMVCMWEKNLNVIRVSIVRTMHLKVVIIGILFLPRVKPS